MAGRRAFPPPGIMAMAEEVNMLYLHCRYSMGDLDLDATVRKWGNSLAIRLPRAFADELGLADGSPVGLSLTDAGLLVTPAGPAVPRLEDLLAGVTRRNLHGEVDTGPAVGREVW